MEMTSYGHKEPPQPLPTVPKLLVTAEEAASALGLGRTSVFRLLRRGELFSLKVEGRRLVPVSALDEFVERLTALQKAS